MEINDKIKGNQRECRGACRLILGILNSSNSKRIVLCLQMIELCSKNGDLLFHKYIGTKSYAQVFLKLLDRKRGKGIKHKFYTKEMKKRWTVIETILLYMIQLWADTFMMMEDEYPGFQIIYR